MRPAGAASHNTSKVPSGCAEHPDCFECEAPDCTWEATDRERFNRWRADHRAELRQKEKDHG